MYTITNTDPSTLALKHECAGTLMFKGQCGRMMLLCWAVKVLGVVGMEHLVALVVAEIIALSKHQTMRE